MTRTLSIALLCSVAWPVLASAQAPASAPLVLAVPSSARVAALGNAWVAGRDQDVVFSNPAQMINVRPDFAVSMAHFGPGANGGSFATVYAAGKLSFTLGAGIQILNFSPGINQASPFGVESLLTRGNQDAQSSVTTVGGAILWKTFRIGASAKYLSDRTSVNRHALVADLGVARNLFGGVAALAVQNLGPAALSDTPAAKLPRQVALGWSRTKPIGPLDFALFTQVTARSGWASPAAGLETGYSWIEGYSITFRAGARRPESNLERPVTLGASFSGDRLTIDYAIRFFDNSRNAHLVTVRWR